MATEQKPPQFVAPFVDRWKQSNYKQLNEYVSVKPRDFSLKVGYETEKVSITPFCKSIKDEPINRASPSSRAVLTYLDPYVSTYNGDFRSYDINDQQGISRKDHITMYEWLQFPKAKGYGLKHYPVKYKGPMRPIPYDELTTKKPMIGRFAQRIRPQAVPHNGMKTEHRTKYTIKELPQDEIHSNIYAIKLEPTYHPVFTTESSMYGSGDHIAKYVDIRKDKEYRHYFQSNPPCYKYEIQPN